MSPDRTPILIERHFAGDPRHEFETILVFFDAEGQIVHVQAEDGSSEDLSDSEERDARQRYAHRPETP